MLSGAVIPVVPSKYCKTLGVWSYTQAGMQEAASSAAFSQDWLVVLQRVKKPRKEAGAPFHLG
jgi:hypothetical protein